MKSKKKKAAKKVATPKGPFYIYLVRRVLDLHFELDEDNKDPHKLSKDDVVLKVIVGGLLDMKACERWLRNNGLEYNDERIIIMHKKLDKILKMKVKTTLGFE